MTSEQAIECIDTVLDSEYHYDETLGYQLTSDDFEWLNYAKQALRERDAIIIKYLKELGECECCKFNDDEHLKNGYCKECCVGKVTRNGWEWKGIQNDERRSD